ncbi:T9SS type B sorting domain-containing protein [Seonamhaeicola sp.]|uniref:T9SS type B sorting domain-containing protein n=1 Tax=Seonamhaeicola sp. TaxID=1912245 RepID=UPI00356620EC
MFIVYEDPTLPGKSITSFDGFSAISVPGGNPTLDIPVSGFRTVPSPTPVRANFAFATLEGDKRITGDQLLLNGYNLSTSDRPANNFFNSSVTQLDATPVTNRNPNSTNTLGFDTGVMQVPNPSNNVIPNGSTSATVRLETSGDTFFPYFFALAVDIIEPNIVLTKIVEDTSGNDISGELVSLGDELNYVIGFQNTGNDNATNLTIRDILPINIVFNYPSNIVSLPPGVSVQSYDSTTREIVFEVDNSVVEVNDPVQEIRFKVSVVQTCSLLNDACDNIINNQAYATYNGTLNPTFTISDDPSFNTNTGCLISPGATNFLADIDCEFREEVILCGDSVVLTAGDNYDSYTWSTSPTGTPVIGNTQSITVTGVGTYYVHNTATAPCQSIDQVFDVITYGAGVPNPVIPFADQVVTCPNDGKELPNFFLCGDNDVRAIETGITDTSSMIWERLDETSCSAVINQDCANEDPACSWIQVATGPDYTIDTVGQYRLTLNYTGGCFNQYYFNVYENLLEPTATSKDIICTTPGEIVVGGVPSGYEYSIDGVNYQTSNTFEVTTAGIYSVYVRQIGVSPNPCVFEVPDVQIRERNFTVSTTVLQPLCYGDLGSIVLAANDVEPQYFFSIYEGATLVNNVGPVTDNNYTFENLNPGTYTVEVSTEDGCTYTNSIEIIEPPLLEVTAALTTPLTCEDGEITIYPVGGTAPYYYFINSTTAFQSTPIVDVSTAGTYNITVVDSNNCSAETSITVEEIEAPTFTISSSDILCYNSNTGEIQFNVTNGNGYSIEYTIDGGTSYSTSPTFSNLDVGVYTVGIKYSLNGVECFSTTQDITITQPDAAVTASSGVSQLAGCGPSGEGSVRITNPQGGTPPYEYSFDNQATWVTTNEADVMPGTYTLYIRDANGCIYAMPEIILDPEPVEPTISIDDPEYNCDGTANTTVTVNNSGTGSFTYRYYLDGVENPNTSDPTTFLNVPDGDHTIKVEYTLSTVPTYSNLLYETFGYGEDTSSPGINPTYYCFERQVEATKCRGSISINDGDYSVTAHIVKPFGTWIDPGDHTPATTPATPDGRFLVVNIGSTIPATEILYEKEINDIIPNQPINFEFYAFNLLNSSSNQYDPNLTVALVDAAGTEISSFDTGAIPKSEQWEVYPKTPMTLDPGSNTTLKFIVRSNVQQTSGNDVAIDDIKVYQLPKVCTTEVEFPFVINSGNAFTADILSYSDVTCDGSADGTIEISAQNFDTTNGYQYSIDGGVNWTTLTTSPYTITGLGVGTYNVQVRYDATSVGCDFSFTQNITAPSLLEVNTSVTPATCSDGAIIEATATGGTPNYSYELLDGTTLNLIASFPSNGVLTNVSTGNYVVRVTDASGCTAVSTSISITTPTNPTATIQTSSDKCYDTVNGATLEVLASGGLAPYEYSLNGSPFVSNNIFANLTPGNYDITVRDANGCEFTLPTEVIAEQLLVSTVLTKDLDCTASSDAEITGTISGGYPPYTYEVSDDGGVTFTSLGSTGTPFTYTALNDGMYQFRITDAQGCTALSTVTTVNPISYPDITSVVETQSILCNGGSDAAIQVNIDTSVGTPPFTINVYNNTTGTDYGTQTTSLPAGDYTVTLTDAKSCTDTETITISEPTPIVLDYDVDPITCAAGGVSLGRIIINSVSGGTPNYTYHVTGVNGYNNMITNQDGSTKIFEVVNFGLYEIIITDANGCSLLEQNILVASPPEDLVINTVATADCTSGGTVEVSIGTPLAGSGPYYFAIYTGPGMTYSATDPAWQPEDSPEHTTFTDLIPGVTYTFIVYDSLTGCYYYETASTPVPTNSTLTVDSVVPKNITCKGSADGEVSFDITSTYLTDTDVTYEVLDSQSLASVGVSGAGTVPANGTLSVTNLGLLPFGNYIILVTEDVGATNEGCSVVTQTPFNITESAIDLGITASVDKNANCNPNSGVISAIATDGTPPYLYQITTTSTQPLPSDALWNSASTFNVNAGTYYVHVMDAYGCIKTTSAQILNNDPTPVIAAAVSNQCTATEGNFEIDVTLTTAGITPYSLSVDGGAFQTATFPLTISNLSSGTHTVEVQDANGCGNMVSVTIEKPLGITPSVDVLPSCLNNDGQISVTAVGGTGSFTYEIIAGPVTAVAQVSNIFTGLAAGTYTVRVNDTNTSCFADVDVTLDAPTPVVFTPVATDVSCNGSSDGSITVNLPTSNDNPIYTYEIIAPITVAPQTSNIFSGLSAGTYTVQVTSGRNCTATETVTINEPNVVSIDATSVVEYACSAGVNAPNYASISVTSVSGGSGNYTIYEFIKGGTIVQSGSQTTYTEADLSGGTYTINVYDDNGCVGTTTETITPFTSLESLDVTVDTAITCNNDEDITVSVTTTGPTPTNLEFIVEDIDATGATGTVYSQTNTTGIFTGLPIGNYSISVTNLDTNCSLQTVHYVNEPNTFDLDIDSVVDVTCFNDNDGSVDVTFIDRSPIPTDEAGPFSYIVYDNLGNTVTTGVVPNAGPTTISGLAQGTYSITAELTNAPFCTVTKNFTITAPTAALDITETHTEITCVSGYNDGSITASATGGWPGGYEYQLELTSGTIITAFSDQYYFTNLSAGDYVVSVRDYKGCIATTNVSLLDPPPISVTLNPDVVSLTCFGDSNGQITANANGGQGSNYTYTLNMVSPTVTSSGPQTSPVFDGLIAGTYNVTVTDGYNCSTTSADIVITEPNEVQATLVKSDPLTCTTDAELTLSATGGSGSYEYSTDASFSTVLGSFSSSVTIPVVDGTYAYYVRDTNGCNAYVSNEITVEPIPDLKVNLDVENATINCAGDTTGVIVAVAEGGLGNYVYTLQDTSGNDITPVTQNTPGVFTELPAGDYQVMVESNDCVATSVSVSITEPSLPLQVNYTVSDVTCYGENNGILEIIATGGTGIIKYAISPQMNQFFDEPIFEDLAPGNYQAIAQDELGCYVLFDFIVNEPTPVTLTIVPNSILPEMCAGDMNGEFSIDISGGTLPYSVALDDINGTYTTGAATQTIFDFTGLSGGDHIVYIVDAEGCESEWNITFPESVLLDPQVTVEYCTDVADATSNAVTVTVDSSVDPAEVDYSLDGINFQSNNMFIDVPAGLNQSITVRHTNGCEQIVYFDVNQYDPLEIALSDGGINEIIAQASGGSGDYEYAIQRVNEVDFEPYGDTGTFVIYESGEYTVSVTDSNGCVATASRYFEFIDVCITNYFTPNGDGNLDTWGPGCTSQYKDLTFDIFDRYGRKVATLRVNEKWDGTYNGKELPTGDYWYIVNLNDERDKRSFVGHFTLYR